MPSQSTIDATASQASLAAARRLSEGGDARQAEAAWRLVLETTPHHAEAWYQLGWLALSAGHYGQAREHLRQATVAAPSVSILHATLARACKLAGEPEQALAALERAVATDPSAWGARFEQADVLASLGRRRAAEMVYQLAITITPPGQLQVPEVKALVARAG